MKTIISATQKLRGVFTIASIYGVGGDNISIGPYVTGLFNWVTIRGRTAGKWLSVTVMVFDLPGCGEAPIDKTRSDFASVSGNQIDLTLEGEINRIISDSSVGLVAYMTGYNSPSNSFPSGKFYAFAGIAPGYDTGAVVTGGTASYDVEYAYLVIDDIQGGSGAPGFNIVGTDIERAGSIGLTADFEAGTLTGEDTGLSVDGVISGGSISGNVEVIYNPNSQSGSLTGELTGYIGDTGTIGAFHGSDVDTVAAGGFVGTAN